MKMSSDHKNKILNKAADTGKSVHLSASAGSGKTRALKDRYLALLDMLDNRGLKFDQAVAITFTDKAAAEIKERVMHDLPEPMLRKIIRGVQDLRISTIHSFCMNLLKRYPLEAGLPPDFGVLDARDQAYKIQKAVEDALEELDGNPEIMIPLRDFTADELIATIEFLISIRSRLKRIEIDAGGPERLLEFVRRGMRAEQGDAELREIISGSEWSASLRRMELILRSQGDLYEECLGREHLKLSEEEDLNAAFRISESLVPVYFNKDGSPGKKAYIAKSKYVGGNRDEYESAYFQVQEMLARFRSLVARVRAGREALSLLRLYLRAEKNYRNAKLREGLLDFDDLEIYAYGLLRNQESSDILYWLDRKILHFLVDEFQDTSDIQWAILNRLTEEIFAGQGADKPMRPTLFVVGDAKQSIYRFREANYRLIENVLKKIETHIPPQMREILTLDENFRSTPEIIETVNRVFTALWKKEYQPSEADRKEHRGSVRLIELVPPPSFEDGHAGPTEAEILAREIKGVVEYRTMIYEKIGNDWKEREAGYGDCAVLIQSRTKLKEYEAALQKEGIPYRVVGGIGFYEEDEIQAIMNVLFFLWNRDDKLSLASALKSPLFGLTDKDIFDLLQDGDMISGLRRLRSGAWGLLNDWARYAGTEPLAGLIHRIVRDTGAYVRFGRRNPQAVFNIDKLLDTAREFDRRGYTTLQDFVEWVKNIREAEQREATADMNLPGFQGAVSVMTVHKAKGLEFPVVFLPGMNQQPRSLSTGPLAIIEESRDGVRMAVKDNANPLYNELWTRENEELRREHQRLLYVAMTRARDRLFMIGTLNNGKAPIKLNSWLDCLKQAIPVYGENGGRQVPCLIACSHPDWDAHVVPMAAASAESSRGERQQEVTVDGEAIIRRISPVPAAETPEWKKATDYIDGDREWFLEQPFVGEGAGGAVSPLVRGTILHRCLETLTASGTYDVQQTAREFPEIVTLGKGAQEKFLKNIEGVLRSVVDNKDFGWIFARRPGSYSELPFLFRKGRAIISGIIDRVIVREDKGFVIDYKAILIENEEALASWKDHYRPQIQIYCEAVKVIFGLQNVEGHLLFLDSSRLEPTAKA